MHMGNVSDTHLIPKFTWKLITFSDGRILGPEIADVHTPINTEDNQSQLSRSIVLYCDGKFITIHKTVKVYLSVRQMDFKTHLAPRF